MGPEQPNLGCILETIRREIADSNVRFVFPSEIAAGLWAQKTCVLGLARSVAVNRFLAWDRFKEEAVRAESQEKEPVSKAVRKLFAENLLERNVKEGLFQALVLPEFADQGSVFAPQIAAMLPALRALGERRTLAGPGYQSDDEDQDFALLEREYGAFLDRHRLFEPAWERPPLKDREHRYYIFFPEAIDDFAEYEATLIAEAETIHITKVDTAGSPPPFRRFGSSSEEIRVAALELRRLHDEEGIPFTDMAISVPGLEDLEPYLLRELTLYDIPVRRRSGRPLAEQGAGRLFSLIQTCVQQNFSFAALKSLILNDCIPWRYPELNRRLIDFGIGHNCVSAYREGGELKDIWREAFRGADPETATLHRYYEGLSRALRRMSGAGDFEAIRRGYFAFRGPSWEKAGDNSTAGTAAPGYPGEFRSFLSRDRLSDEGDAVLARCVEELSALIRLKEDFPDLAVRSPFGFYLSTLKEIQYVPAGQKPGLNLFPYRTAAAAPFSCHFVLNASQSAATVLYEPLSFLGQDKRRALGLADTDASGAFFRLYGSIDRDGRTGPAEISAADETYSGWTIPHSFFAGQGDTKTVDGGTLDPFALERNWWAYRQDGAGRDTAAAFPKRIYPVQRTGFDNWCFPLAEKRAGEYNLFAGAFPRAMPAFDLLNRILSEKQRHLSLAGEPLVRVSATDLNAFFGCSLLWFFKKILGLKGFSLEAKLLDDTFMGNLYHGILEALFTRIRGEDTRFIPGRLPEYRQWASKCTAEAAANFRVFQSPLASPLLMSQSTVISKKICALLETEGEKFAGYTVGALEQEFDLVEDGMFINGRFDRISISPDDDAVIIDYKFYHIPSQNECRHTEGAPLEDFQMALYIKLYEASKGISIGNGYFISILKNDMTTVLKQDKKIEGSAREQYQSTLDALEAFTRDFRDSVESLNFAPGEIPYKQCVRCDYRPVCRSTYNLNRNTVAGEAVHAG